MKKLSILPKKTRLGNTMAFTKFYRHPKVIQVNTKYLKTNNSNFAVKLRCKSMVWL